MDDGLTAVEVAEHVGELLLGHGEGGGWVVVTIVGDDQVAELVLIDAAAQRSYRVAVKENVA